VENTYLETEFHQTFVKQEVVAFQVCHFHCNPGCYRDGRWY
jgi:hypothetical protein